MQFRTFLITVLFLISCNYDAVLLISVKEQISGIPIDSANIVIHRTDRTRHNYGGFTALTDSTGHARFVLTSNELKDYLHSVFTYKEGMFQTEQSGYDIDGVKKLIEIHLTLSNVETDYHRSMTTPGDSPDSTATD